MIRHLPFRAAIAALALLFALPCLAQSPNWPTKPVRIINPFPAGGGTDAYARPLSARLSTQSGSNFYVENLGGAGGTLGATTASKAAPDGYTFFMGAIHHTIAPSLYPKLGYDIEKDFVPVSVVAYLPNVVVIHPKLPFRNIGELIAFAKANPGKLNFGSAGNGTSHHLAGELFKNVTGVNITHVPYKGAGPMMQDLLGGNVDMAFDGMGSSAPQIKSGKLKPLAVTTSKRSPLIPDTPTMAEAGVKNYDVTTWYAFWAPKGTPPEIIEKFRQEIFKAMDSPEVKRAWEQQGAEFRRDTPAEMQAFVRQEIVRWAKVVKDGNVKVDF